MADKTQDTHNTETNLEEEKSSTGEEQESNNTNTKDINWEEEAQKRKKKYEEAEEIGKKAQFDYYNVKMDFDGYVQRMEQKAKTQQIETLATIVRKFLPFIESLRKSIDTIPESQHEEPLVKGIILTYNKFLQTLETMGITPIVSIGKAPDNTLHEPVSMQETEDKKLKGKIIQEFEKGYIYRKNDIEKVISTAKVVIGQ